MLKNSHSSGSLFFLAFTAMLFAQYFLIFDPTHARKLFYLASYISIVLALFSYRNIITSHRNIIPTLGIFFLSFTFFIWLALYKHHGAFFDIYIAYKTSAKILLLLAILVFIFSNVRLPHYPRLLDAFFLAGGLLVNLYAVYQYNFHPIERVELGFDRATIAAYIITITDIFMVYAALNRDGWFRYILFACIIIMTFGVLIITETRAAILSYPLLCLFLVFTHPMVNKQHQLKILLFLTGLLIIAGYTLKKPVEQRLNALTSDLQTLRDTHNSQTSVGARIAMLHVGLDAGQASLWGQSAESRSDRIEGYVSKAPEFQGALTFIDVHLHNEFIENFSLRGIFGVFALFNMYISLLWYSYKQRNPLLMVITLSLIMYGLSDVIFFSREASIAYAIGILCAIVPFRREDEFHGDTHSSSRNK